MTNERHPGDADDPRDDAAIEARLDEAARKLPREIPPGRDLWPGIAARIARESLTPDRVSGGGNPASGESGHGSASGDVAPGDTPASRPRWAVVGERLALAATITVIAVAGWVALGPSTSGPDTASSAGPVLETLDALEAECALARDTLRRTLADGGGTASPEVIDVLQVNLAIIQTAIDETRDALSKNPHDPSIATYLAHELYADELALIRTSTRLATNDFAEASSDAGQEE